MQLPFVVASVDGSYTTKCSFPAIQYSKDTTATPCGKPSQAPLPRRGQRGCERTCKTHQSSPEIVKRFGIFRVLVRFYIQCFVRFYIQKLLLLESRQLHWTGLKSILSQRGAVHWYDVTALVQRALRPCGNLSTALTSLSTFLYVHILKFVFIHLNCVYSLFFPPCLSKYHPT